MASSCKGPLPLPACVLHMGWPGQFPLANECRGSPMATVQNVPDEDPTAEFPAISECPARVNVAFGAASHVGRVREKNEDQFLIAKLAKSMRICFSSLNESETTRFSDEEGYLMIVADGMGGTA